MILDKTTWAFTKAEFATLARCVSRDTSRGANLGALWFSHKGRRVFATDGHRLIVAALGDAPANHETPAPVGISLDTVTALLRSAGGRDTIAITFEKAQALVSVYRAGDYNAPKFGAAVPLHTNGTPPPIDQVLPGYEAGITNPTNCVAIAPRLLGPLGDFAKIGGLPVVLYVGPDTDEPVLAHFTAGEEDGPGPTVWRVVMMPMRHGLVNATRRAGKAKAGGKGGK